MSQTPGNTPRSFKTAVAQRDVEAEIADCVGGVLSPLLANIALSVLDEHLHAPWKPGGSMCTAYQRRSRRCKNLPNWRLVRYADDFARHEAPRNRVGVEGSPPPGRRSGQVKLRAA